MRLPVSGFSSGVRGMRRAPASNLDVGTSQRKLERGT
jgi:hypothetical protein